MTSVFEYDASDWIKLNRNLSRLLNDRRFGNKSIAAREALARFLNSFAEENCVIGGAFAFTNIETNKFVLRREYYLDEDTNDYNLFPYLKPKHTLEELSKTEYSEWMHNLFNTERMEQSLSTEVSKTSETGQSAVMQVPEIVRASVLGETVGDPIVVKYQDIRTSVLRWIQIWLNASHSCGIQGEIGNTNDDLERMTLHSNLMAVIEVGVRNLDDSITKELPEYDFFLNESDIPSHIEFARILLKKYSVLEILEIIGFSLDGSELIDSHKQYGDLNTAESNMEFKTCLLNGNIFRRKNKTYLDALQHVHSESFFPIIPYFFLLLVDERELNHAAIPVLTSTAFPVSIKHKGQNIGELYSPVYFLGTFSTPRKKTEQITDYSLLELIYLISPILEKAASPLIDELYYGGVQRNLLKLAQQKKTFQQYFGAITHELSPLQNALLGSWMVPINTIHELKDEQYSTAKLILKDTEIIPMPKNIRMVANKVSLWTVKDWASSGRISKSPKKMEDLIPLSEVMNMLFKVASDSHVVSENAKSVPKNVLHNLALSSKYEDKWGKESMDAFNLFKIREGSDIESLFWFQNIPDDQSVLLDHFCRLIVAISGNALKHSKGEQVFVDGSLDRESSHFRLLFTNKIRKAIKDQTEGTKTTHRNKVKGTENVMRFLVSLLNGNPEDVRFYDFVDRQETRIFLAEITVPAPFIRSKNG